MLSERGDLPSGLVTFVLTDIEGSTRLFRAEVDRYPEMLQRHREIVRAVWPSFGGVEVSTEGDGTLVAFDTAAGAVGACVQAQRDLVTEAWPVPLRVRMGMHTGLAHPLDGDYVALAVHQAARVAATAHGGQVVASAVAVEHAGHVAGVRFAPLGRYRLRDFDAPVALTQLVADGLPDRFPAVRATPAEGRNFSVPTTSFVGREDDLDAAVAALAAGRLVTLVGPGGVGKSRLAVEMALRLADRWPDGVWRVPVEDVTVPGAVVEAVADAVAVRVVTHEPARELASALRGRRALLLLDGCEQQVSAVADLVELLLGTTRLALLVTSREPLHVRGEVVRRLQPLPVVGTTAPGSTSPAARLYLDRVEAAGAATPSTAAQLAAVSTLVDRLDGLPLALEIAAGFASAFTPEQMLAELDHDVGALRTHDRATPERQRSLAGLLASSERLLSEGERAVLRRLAVFTGSFPLAAARAVAASDPVVPEQVPDHVWSLVDRSLVLADVSGGQSRYRLLQTVRQFERRRLDEQGEAASAWLRAASWLLDEVGPGIVVGPGTLGRLAAELDNLRGLVDETTSDDPPDIQQCAQLLALALARYHDGAQSYRLGIAEVTRTLERLPAPTPARVALLTQASMLHLQAGELPTADRLLDEAARLRDQVGIVDGDEASVERALGELAVRRRDPESAVRIASDALGRPLPPLARARMCNLLTLAHHEAGDPEQTGDAARRCLEACEALGDEVMLAAALGNLAEAELRLGQIASAAGHQQRSLRLAEALGQPVTMAYALNLAARMAVASDPTDQAAYEAAVSLVVRAQAVLDEAGQRLYREDAAATDAMLAEARRVLGPAVYGAAQRSGRELTLDAAVDRAALILTDAEV